MLRDRRNERVALDQLIEAIRAGESHALVMRGEPGVGKTALLDYLVEQAQGCRIARTAGVQSEMELPFAGLHQLCAPMLDGIEGLPIPQREALGTAFGLSAGSPPDRFLVGLAVLGLLAEVAQETPLLCVVDDAQWLDFASTQALTFVARRLVAESVGLVLAMPVADGVAELAGLPELVVTGLPDSEARALLESALPGPVDRPVIDRVIAEAHGNPLALQELPRTLTPAELASGFTSVGAGALPKRIEDSYRRQLRDLPPETRQLLLVAAAEPLGDPLLVRHAASRLGIHSDAALPATAAGLVSFGARVRFRHPLERSAVYRSASAQQRRDVHAALAEVTDVQLDPDRRAWHRAQAAVGPDESVAAELEQSAGRAQARGGLAAAAAFLERSAELTMDPANQAGRALAAAQALGQAGAPEAALGVLALAQTSPLDRMQRARVDLLRARIGVAVDHGSDAGPLLAAAGELEPLDVDLARATYLSAFSAALFAGRLATGAGLLAVAHAAAAAPPPTAPARAPDLLLDGLVTRFTDGYPAGAPKVRSALQAFRTRGIAQQSGMRLPWLACIAAADVWDDDSLEELAGDHLRLAWDAGELAELPLGLTSRVAVHAFTGELAAASLLIEELEATLDATGIRLVPYAAVILAAWRGRESEAFELIEITVTRAQAQGEGFGLTVANWAKALVCNSLGRYEEALGAAEQATEHPEELGIPAWALAELVVAAIRTGQEKLAADALDRLTEITAASGTDWGLGVTARSRALLRAGPSAESLYQEAIERLGRTRIRGELARAHLDYGEWLRREHRRLDAREQLRTAHQMFTEMEMEAFANRAARELKATGETARKRSVDTATELTGQEVQISRLVGEGLTNPEIAARLFISPRTVEWHLSKIFGKLNITSRRQLYR